MNFKYTGSISELIFRLVSASYNPIILIKIVKRKKTAGATVYRKDHAKVPLVKVCFIY